MDIKNFYSLTITVPQKAIKERVNNFDGGLQKQA